MSRSSGESWQGNHMRLSSACPWAWIWGERSVGLVLSARPFEYVSPSPGGEYPPAPDGDGFNTRCGALHGENAGSDEDAFGGGRLAHVGSKAAVAKHDPRAREASKIDGWFRDATSPRTLPRMSEFAPEAMPVAAPASETGANESRNPFAIAGYRVWWAASIVAGTGVGIQSVTVPLFIRDRVAEDHRAALIALALICQTIPGAAFALIAQRATCGIIRHGAHRARHAVFDRDSDHAAHTLQHSAPSGRPLTGGQVSRCRFRPSPACVWRSRDPAFCSPCC